MTASPHSKSLPTHVSPSKRSSHLIWLRPGTERELHRTDAALVRPSQDGQAPEFDRAVAEGYPASVEVFRSLIVEVVLVRWRDPSESAGTTVVRSTTGVGRRTHRVVEVMQR